jgi:hypothetical protein
VALDGPEGRFLGNPIEGVEMKSMVFALLVAIFTLAACSTQGGGTGYPERTELQPGYFDPD